MGSKLFKPLTDMFGIEFVTDLKSSNWSVTIRSALTKFVFEENLRVVVCGGDGTVQSVMNEIDLMLREDILRHRPGVAILPLGTGNDLSRHFGWGHGFSRHVLQRLKTDVRNASRENLDRWSLTITENSEERKLSFSNYFGIGVDAKVVADFHSCRESYPGLYCCRFSNNMIYAFIGSVYYLGCHGRLSAAIEVTIDGAPFVLSQGTRGISMTNLKYYCGGSDMWTSTPGDINDGSLEVFLMPGPFYIGAMKVGLVRPKFSTQCKEMIIKSSSSLVSGSKINIQVDGEPTVLTAPFKLVISVILRGNAIMLRGSSPPSVSCDICC